MRRVPVALALTTALVLAGCGSDGARRPDLDPRADRLPATPPFADMLRAVQRDYEPAKTFEELARRSRLVVVGRLHRVVAGRVVGAAPDDLSRTEHVVLVFTVERVVSGRLEPGVAEVYVEYPSSQAWPASAYDAAAPKGARAALYLVPAPAELAGQGQRVFDPGTVPAGRALHTVTTPQGLLLLDRGSVTAPLQRVPPARLFPGELPDETAIETWLPGR